MCRVHHPNGSLPRLKYGNNVVEVNVGLVGTISDDVTLFDVFDIEYHISCRYDNITSKLIIIIFV